jgi:hypothetical protein
VCKINFSRRDPIGREEEISLWREASPEETEEIIENIAQQVVKREMELPAIFIFGTMRPVSYIGGQLIRVFLAAFTPLLGNLRYEYISVLEKNENLVRLIARINELSDEREEKRHLKKEEKGPDNNKKGRKWYNFFSKNK